MLERRMYPQLESLIISVEISAQLQSYNSLKDIIEDSAEIYAPFDINIKKLKDDVLAEADSVISDSANILKPIKNLQDLLRRCYIKYYIKVFDRMLPNIIYNLLVDYIRKNNIWNKYDDSINLTDFIRNIISEKGSDFTYDNLIELFREKFSLDK